MTGDSRKRKMSSPKYFSLQSFLQPGYPISVSGTFRDNVRLFLEECVEVQDHDVEGMRIWQTFLVDETGSTPPLYTIEECVNKSLKPLCDHCRCSGWGHHFVSKRRYHFIIPADNEWTKRLDNGVLELQTHILHGLIHCNGFGHLLCINGSEGGSNFVCGRQVMDLWDRICTTLHSRKINVVDTSKKRKMDLRLLYGVSYGQTWFERWGYRFCHVSFGVTKDKYDQALQVLSSLELDIIVHNLQHFSVKKIISRYRDLSDMELLTIRDLFRFMLSLKFQTPEKKNIDQPRPKRRCRKFSSVAAKLESQWDVGRLEQVAKVVVDALKEKKAGMSREEVRDMAHLHIGDTDLIDRVLKSMDNVIVGGYVVRRALSSITGVVEYSLEESRVDSSDIYEDLDCLYHHVLLDSDLETVKLAVRRVLDSKNFTKEWPFNTGDDGEFLRFICRVIPLVPTERRNSVGEQLVIPVHATIRDLKSAAEFAMRDTYCVMENLKVTEIVELEGVADNEDISEILKSGSQISVRVSGLDQLSYEGGADDQEVNCKCGARIDDGERMVACNRCGAWQHTWCSGIHDSEAAPLLFMCSRCRDKIGPQVVPEIEG